MMAGDAVCIGTNQCKQGSHKLNNIPGGDPVGGTGTVDVTGGQAAKTAGRSVDVTGQGKGVESQ